MPGRRGEKGDAVGMPVSDSSLFLHPDAILIVHEYIKLPIPISFQLHLQNGQPIIHWVVPLTRCPSHILRDPPVRPDRQEELLD